MNKEIEKKCREEGRDPSKEPKLDIRNINDEDLSKSYLVFCISK
jgi:hypothetical protein